MLQLTIRGKGRFHIGQRDILKQLLTEQSIELVDAGKQGSIGSSHRYGQTSSLPKHTGF